MNIMSQSPVSEAPASRFFDQREILRALLRGWWLIALGLGIGIVLAINYLRTAPFLYQAQMQITPAQQSASEGGPSAIAGLASLANFALPSVQGASEFRLYIDSLQSRELADKLAQDRSILMPLYGGQWNAVAGRWEEPPLAGMSAFTRRIKDFLGIPSRPWHPPDGETMLEFMRQTLAVQQDQRRPYIATVTFRYYDPDYAVTFLNALHTHADDALRQRALQRTADNISYLSATLGRVTVAEHRAAITAALSEQEKAAMVARGGSSFAADLFERPWVATMPIEPSATRVFLNYGLLGVLGGASFALLYWVARSHLAARRNRLGR